MKSSSPIKGQKLFFQIFFFYREGEKWQKKEKMENKERGPCTINRGKFQHEYKEPKIQKKCPEVSCREQKKRFYRYSKMAIADLIVLVEKLLDEDNLTEAEKKVDQLCQDVETPSFKILDLKAQVLLRRKKYKECQAVATEAAELAYSNGKRNQISEALKLLAMAFFRCKDYDNALKYITHSSSYDDSQNSEIRMFSNMVAQKYKKAHEVSEEQLEKIKLQILSVPLKFKTAAEVKKGLKASPPATPATPATTTSPVSTSSKSDPVKQRMRLDWFDSGKTVEISLYVKRINSESVKATILSNSIDIKFQDADKFDYEYKVDKLYSSIDEAESSYKVYGTKLQIVLVKRNSKTWHALERQADAEDIEDKEALLQDETPKEDEKNSLAYPSSSAKKIDWSKFDIDDEKEEEDQDPDSFFKKLYENADEDAKRAMMKSFMESNGTSLSTDWKDVGSREVKPYEEESKD